MPRRTATMLASLLMLIGLLCAGVLIHVPYAEMSPGPSYNTLGRHNGECVLRVSGQENCDAVRGHLNMTTVRVTGSDYKMNLVEAVYGWLGHDDIVVPHDTLYPDDKSPDEVNQENAAEFSESQESAKVAALRELRRPVRSRVVVAAVVKDSPSRGKLHAGDVIREVDGSAVHEPGDVAKLVTKHRPGQRVVFSIVPAKQAAAAEKSRDDSAYRRSVTITTRKAPDGDRAVVGIQAGTDYTLPVRIDIRLADVGGPSAGLMFALGIVDKMSPVDLTGGKFVAGTGTIDDQGRVGPIGGVELKTIGARKAGARYFFTPAENCPAAAGDVPGGLTLVKVTTLHDALESLKKIRTGDTAGLPRCAG
ncbi:PDZ domain-containing protein [Streptomyces sp. B1866]|uniref:YlbL family protein n=1 Tax=Streptomyces sp. B1866 TaxID=3075431 RepID=UPI00288D6DE6|nr:PDZ domain-containing protein [Streptomyces sp. B1866]MDT3396368.1 PDZ domain-containing protein [Streptomyces sp. B1866]